MTMALLAKGLLSYVPGFERRFLNPTAGVGTDDAAYCYGVWLKHLTLLHNAGMREIPRCVVELGPGSSIGVGLAALLSGSESYIAVDAVMHTTSSLNAAVFPQLVAMFRARAPRPRRGFPDFDRYLDEKLFPSAVLPESHLATTLSDARIARIEDAMAKMSSPDASMVRFRTWSQPDPVVPASADLVLSHVSLNQADDLETIYRKCGEWTRPGGWTSHQIDFSALRTTREWNGHWRFDEPTWKLIRGRRSYFMNREPVSTHLHLLRQNGFEIVDTVTYLRDDGIKRSEMAPRWRAMSDEDARTQTLFVVARRT